MTTPVSGCSPSIDRVSESSVASKMIRKAYLRTTGSVFFLVAFVHLLRIVFAWTFVVAGWAVPQWMSAVAVLVAGYLAYEGLRLSRE